MTDKKGVITYVNDLFCEVAKYSRDELIGQPHNIVRHPDMPAEAFKSMWETIGRGDIFRAEVKNRNKDGEPYYVDALIAPILGSDGKPEAYIGVRYLITDIVTAREKAATEIKRNFDSLDQAVDSIVKINKNKEITFFNKASEKLFDVKKEDVMGENVKVIVPEVFRRDHDSFVDANINGGPNKVVGSSREIFVKTSAGEEIPVSLSLSKVVLEDDIEYTAFIKDITEDVRNKERINQTLEQALDGVVTIDGKTKEILFFNKAAEKMWGYDREEVLGKNIKVIVPPEHQASHDGYVDANVNGGPNKIVGTSRDVKAVRKDGSIFWTNLSISKVVLGDQVIYTSFAKDVTQQVANKMAFDEAIKFIDAVTNGDFDEAMNVTGLEMDNETSNVIANLEQLRSNLKEIIGAVNEVVNEAGVEGHLSARIDLQAHGQWADLVKSVNELLISISAPMLEIKQVIEHLAEGDLTDSFDESSVKGDIALMGGALNIAIKNIGDILGNIKNMSTTVATSAEEMLSAGREMKSTTGEVASAIAEMSEGAAQTAQRTDESSRLIGDVSGVAKDMAGKAESINNAAEKGQDSCVSGLETIKKVVDNMVEIQTSASATSASIDILTERSEEIARTLNVITEIAAQTNLLALNAAIEAARAGEAGRGFAVVAEEIRNLAENSRNSAVDIEKVIKEVQKDIAAATKQIDLMSGSVKSGNEASLAAEKVFENIEETSSMTLGLAKEIVSASESQMTSINSVVKNIESIVVVSEETATGAEEIASSSTELDSAMNEVTSNSQNLADLAVELQTGVDRFKLD